MHKITAYEAQVWARKQRLGGDVAAKIILMLLSDYADEWGTCFPGMERIAEETELSRSTVLRKMKVLAECGLVSIERRANDRGHRTSNRYVLELDVIVTAEQFGEAKARVAAEHPSTTTVLGVNVTPGSPPPPKSHPERGAQVSSGDTGTTSRTTSYPYSPQPEQASIPVEEPPADAESLGDPCMADGTSEGVLGPEEAFEAFWKAYPRKTGTSKAQARVAFVRALRGDTSPKALVEALHMACMRWTAERTETRFIPHAATWLNQQRWETVEPVDSTGNDDPWAGVPHPADAYGQNA